MTSECAICLENFPESESHIRLKCSHTFHEECWFEMRTSGRGKPVHCPCCRELIADVPPVPEEQPQMGSAIKWDADFNDRLNDNKYALDATGTVARTAKGHGMWILCTKEGFDKSSPRIKFTMSFNENVAYQCAGLINDDERSRAATTDFGRDFTKFPLMKHLGYVKVEFDLDMANRRCQITYKDNSTVKVVQLTNLSDCVWPAMTIKCCGDEGPQFSHKCTISVVE